MNKIDDESIKSHLKNMPEVKDYTTKEEWVERIQPKRYRKKRIRKGNSKMIPIFSTALVVAIMFLIIPSIIQGPSPTNELTSTTNHDVNSRMIPEGEQGSEFESASINEEDLEKEKGQYVLFDINDDEQIVYGGTFDQQVEYTVPLAFITSKEQSLSESYNELHTYIDKFDSTSNIPYFKGVTFDIDEDEKVVTMHVPDDYTIGEGSAIQGKFEKMMSTIFYPYGIKEIQIETEDHSPLILGEIGELQSIEVKKPATANYKHYYDDAYEQSFLIPVEQSDASFTAAIEDLKNNDEDFSVQQTIPKDLDLMITCDSEEDCIIVFENNVHQLSENELTLAIESILMTAKSYGFKQLTFKGLLEDAIEGYNFSQPIDVPLAVNPVHIQ